MTHTVKCIILQVIVHRLMLKKDLSGGSIDPFFYPKSSAFLVNNNVDSCSFASQKSPKFQQLKSMSKMLFFPISWRSRLFFTNPLHMSSWALRCQIVTNTVCVFYSRSFCNICDAHVSFGWFTAQFFMFCSTGSGHAARFIRRHWGLKRPCEKMNVGLLGSLRCLKSIPNDYMAEVQLTICTILIFKQGTV